MAKICPKCGTKLTDNFRFCVRCGADLDQLPEKDTSDFEDDVSEAEQTDDIISDDAGEKKKMNSSNKSMIITVGVVILAVIILATTAGILIYRNTDYRKPIYGFEDALKSYDVSAAEELGHPLFSAVEFCDLKENTKTVFDTLSKKFTEKCGCDYSLKYELLDFRKSTDKEYSKFYEQVYAITDAYGDLTESGEEEEKIQYLQEFAELDIADVAIAEVGVTAKNRGQATGTYLYFQLLKIDGNWVIYKIIPAESRIPIWTTNILKIE